MTRDATKTTERSSRRRFLGGAAAVFGLLATRVLGRASPAQAADGDTVKLGNSLQLAFHPTWVNDGTDTDVAFGARSGFMGDAGHGTGTGLMGISGPQIVAGGPKTGVHGYAIHDSSSNGVLGQSAAGSGVHGTATSGTGVFGEATSGNGVHGHGSGAGHIGVWGEGTGGATGVQGTAGANGVAAMQATHAGTGPALAAVCAFGTGLQVTGKAQFSRSGVITVPAGQNQVTRTGIELTSGSLVLATVQQTSGGAFVKCAVPNPAASSFTIHLNKTPTVPVKVAWFVLN